MRRDDQRQAVKNIPLEQLKPFKNHPFQVRDDEEFRRLVESIEIHGVIPSGGSPDWVRIVMN